VHHAVNLTCVKGDNKNRPSIYNTIKESDKNIGQSRKILSILTF